MKNCKAQLRIRHCQSSILATLVIALTCSLGWCQDDSEEPVYLREPFDRVILDEANNNARLDVFLLDFPGRDIPTDPKKPLRIRLIKLPDQEFDVDWSHIRRIELFEEIVLKEGNRLTADGNFDSAYYHYAYLLREAPNHPGLSAAMQNFLLADAGASFRNGDLQEALGLLQDVYAANPNRQGTKRAISKVTTRLFDQYIEQGNYGGARSMLTWAAEKLSGEELKPTLDRWQQTLTGLAAKEKRDAESHMAAGRTRQAYEASRRMMLIWPKISGGVELARTIGAQYKQVNVAVSRLSQGANPNHYHDWSVRRSQRLKFRQVVEVAGIGSDGGQYFCPFGQLRVSDDRRQMILQVDETNGARVNGYDVSQTLLQLADANNADHLPIWNELLAGIHVENVFEVRADIRRPFLQLASLWQTPWRTASDVNQMQPYLDGETDESTIRYLRNADYLLLNETQPQEIVERKYDSTPAALGALRAGDVDIVERLFPADIPSAVQDESISVASYAIPSVHFLVPNFERPYMDKRGFRRALAYGISRETLLKKDLLANKDVQGCRLISGPFPAGRSDDDSLSYAYNSRVRVLPYEPRLSAIRFEIVRRQMEEVAKKTEAEPPQPPKLTLLYPNDEIPRIACEGISQYLTALGIECTPQPLPPGATRPQNDNWDLLYVDALITEPIFDAGRLLGPGGVAGGGSPYVNAALRKLALAENWNEARQQLNRIHRLVHDELAIIPLWQLVDYYAYRKELTGLKDSTVNLYQDIEAWQLEIRDN